MTDKPNDGGPAFPTDRSQSTEFGRRGSNEPGMTLRDWFAGQATEQDIEAQQEWIGNPLSKLTRAQCRYLHADAMLAARGEGV